MALTSRRDSPIIHATLVGLLSRSLALISPLVVIPTVVKYLGDERYGLWMSVTSITGMGLFADLGLGNGLLTRLSRCYGMNDANTARRYTSNAYIVLSGFSLILTAMLATLAPYVPWSDLFNIRSPELKEDALSIAAACLAPYILNIPLSLVDRVQFGHQHGWQANAWQALTGVLTLVSVQAAVSLKAPGWLVVGAATFPLTATYAISSSVYYSLHPERGPALHAFDRPIAIDLLSIGSRFVILSAVQALALNIDNILIARTLTLEAVTEYAIPAKASSVLNLIVTVVCLPFWPAAGEALARGDHAWVRKATFRIAVASGSSIALGGLGFVVFGNTLLDHWIARPLHAPRWLLVGLVGWTLLSAVTAPYFMVLNAAGVLKLQLIGWCAFLAVSVTLKLILAQHVGLAGIPIGACIAYMITLVPLVALGHRNTIRRLDTSSA